MDVEPDGSYAGPSWGPRAWQHEARGRGIALEIAVGDPPPIRADYDKLRRVMDNLVKNALEAIDRGPGVIRVAVEFRYHEVAPERDVEAAG